ncbi:MAG: hypothetical protein P1U75_20310 [Antarcticimicrobium sp.]|uniref:hypothetical protein n=1 Tax=Antarcticimicrobium sp. TaxID=2824147 RepID=UPI00262D7F84|nr:hypothetical protein [Antarcticimicrobium sp.]MDF1718983.1 hypothetical protein [Antarcticimicrobium sp.]
MKDFNHPFFGGSKGSGSGGTTGSGGACGSAGAQASASAAYHNGGVEGDAFAHWYDTHLKSSFDGDWGDARGYGSGSGGTKGSGSGGTRGSGSGGTKGSGSDGTRGSGSGGTKGSGSGGTRGSGSGGTRGSGSGGTRGSGSGGTTGSGSGGTKGSGSGGTKGSGSGGTWGSGSDDPRISIKGLLPAFDGDDPDDDDCGDAKVIYTASYHTSEHEDGPSLDDVLSLMTIEPCDDDPALASGGSSGFCSTWGTDDPDPMC